MRRLRPASLDLTWCEMKVLAASRHPVTVLQPLRAASLGLPFLAGAWMGLALAPLAIGAAWLGTTCAVIDAIRGAADR